MRNSGEGQTGPMRHFEPDAPFFYWGPYLSIDEGRKPGCPWSGASLVCATGQRTLPLATPGMPLDANLAAWLVALSLPGGTGQARSWGA